MTPWDERIVRLREGLSLTQADLAYLLNTTRITVGNWERAVQRPFPCFERIVTALEERPEETMGILQGRPDPLPEEIQSRARSLKEFLGLTRQEMADILATSSQTLFRKGATGEACPSLMLWVLEQYAELDPKAWPLLLRPEEPPVAKPPLTGATIRELRKSFGMPQREFGPLIGVSKEALASWEVGRWAPNWCADLLLKMLEEYPGPTFDLLEKAWKIPGPWDGSRFRAVREQMGMTQEELAEFLNVSYEALQKHETGKPILTKCDILLFGLLERYRDDVIPMIERIR